ncbi:MAG: glucose 1-dehydrogenase [Anaerolineaceae bacterium]|nr:glucose 1-dehydrogenase [Anaerolineaceae bacterium]
MKRFTDRVAVVTGGSTGIGRACAQEFAAEGAAVVIADVNEGQGAELAASIDAAGGQALFQRTDVAREESVARMVAAACEHFGGIDFLVNSAAVQTYGSVVTTDEDTWDRTIDVNLKGIYLASRHCIPAMAARGGGAVISIASVQGILSQPDVAAYAATKGAIIAMTRTMALDHAGEGVRVNAVSPGSIDTPMLRESARLFQPEAVEETLESWGDLHPLGRVGQPREIARVALFLCSEDASFMTGANVVVDGGLSIGLFSPSGD